MRTTLESDADQLLGVFRRNAQNPSAQVPFGAHCALSLHANEPPP